MEHLLYANGSSPPSATNGGKGRLAQAYDSGNIDAIYKAVYSHAESLLRYSGREYAEGHINHEDLAQDLAIKVMRHLAEGLFTGTGKEFVSWVDKITFNKRKDFYRAANRIRKTTVPLMVTREDEDGKEEVENPDIAHAGERLPCSRYFDTSAIDAEILQVMCDDIKGVRYSRYSRPAMPALSATDEAIVKAMRDDKPTYAEVAAQVGMTAKQVENRLNTIRRRERKKREQSLAATAPKIIACPAGIGCVPNVLTLGGQSDR